MEARTPVIEATGRIGLKENVPCTQGRCYVLFLKACKTLHIATCVSSAAGSRICRNMTSPLRNPARFKLIDRSAVPPSGRVPACRIRRIIRPRQRRVDVARDVLVQPARAQVGYARIAKPPERALNGKRHVAVVRSLQVRAPRDRSSAAPKSPRPVPLRWARADKNPDR